MECHIAVPKMSLVLILQYNKIVMSDSLSKELRKLCVFLFPSFLFFSLQVLFPTSVQWKQETLLEFSSLFRQRLKEDNNYIIPLVYTACSSVLSLPILSKMKVLEPEKINALLFSDFSCMFLHALEGE